MENNRKFSTALADIIMEHFSIGQMKRYVYLDKIPRLIFHLQKDGKELDDYKKIDDLLSYFKGNLKWGVFKCPRSKINYMISPVKWYEIEQDINFRGEQYMVDNLEYLNLLKLATMDYEPLVDHLNVNLNGNTKKN